MLVDEGEVEGGEGEVEENITYNVSIEVQFTNSKMSRYISHFFQEFCNIFSLQLQRLRITVEYCGFNDVYAFIMCINFFGLYHQNTRESNTLVAWLPTLNSLWII